MKLFLRKVMYKRSKKCLYNIVIDEVLVQKLYRKIYTKGT